MAENGEITKSEAIDFFWEAASEKAGGCLNYYEKNWVAREANATFWQRRNYSPDEVLKRLDDKCLPIPQELRERIDDLEFEKKAAMEQESPTAAKRKKFSRFEARVEIVQCFGRRLTDEESAFLDRVFGEVVTNEQIDDAIERISEGGEL